MIYVVTFDTNHRTEQCLKHYVFHCHASNAREAVQIARQGWPQLFGDNPRFPRQIHLHAVRSRSQDPARAHVVTWCNDHISGEDCFDYYCTGTTAWSNYPGPSARNPSQRAKSRSAQAQKPDDSLVTVICYGIPKVCDRAEAIRFFSEGVRECDGSEKARYATILSGLLAGYTTCCDR